jgi:hypothetical protein
MKFPDFIIIGVAKCGTTPLWFNLDKHPDITMAPRRLGKTEMYFWGTKNYKDKGIDWYKKKFKGKVCGEKTPKYCTRKISQAQMKKHIPDVKLIMCVRHPVERAFSNYRMNHKGDPTGRGFNLQQMVRHYAKLGRYINLIERNVTSVFDKSQLHVCVTEWLKKDTVEEMNKIYDFLGLKRVNIKRKVVNVRNTYVSPASKNMEIRRGEPWYRVWDQYENTITGNLRKEGLKIFKPYNERLFKFLGYEIEEWKK